MANIGTLAGKLEMDTSPWEKSAKTVQQQAKGLGDSINRVVEQAAGFAAGQAGMLAFGKGVDAAKQAVFGMNSTLETAELQFTTLMGSAAAAKAQVADIFEIAKKTPFETGPILQASKTLQTFGGAALNTKSEIIAIGDAAAASGAPINELAFWVGRAYSMIQGGQPFGEAAMRLQELAILTPQARQQMEALQKAGASQAEVWGVLQQEIGRFGGAMEKQAGTWAGLTSTFSDSSNILISRVFQPLFKVAEQTLGRINEFLDTPEVEAWANSMTAHVTMVIQAIGILGGAFGRIFGSIANTVITVGKIIYEGLQWINPFARHSDPLVDQVQDGINLIIRKYQDLGQIQDPIHNIEGLITNLEAVSASGMAKMAQQTLDLKMITLSYLGRDVPQAYAAAVGTIQSFNTTLADLRTQIADQRTVVQDWKEQLDEASLAVRDQQTMVHNAERELLPYQQAVSAAKAEMQPFAEAHRAAKDELQGIKDQISDVTASLRPYQLAVDAANRAMGTQQLSVDAARIAMTPFKDAVDDVQFTIQRLSDQLSNVKDKMSDLQRIPLAGSEKFRKQLEDTTDRANKVKLQIAQMGASGVKSGSQIDNLRQQLDKLDSQAESIRLTEAVQLAPQRRQIDQAMNPQKAEQPFDAILAQATQLGQQRTAIEGTMDAAKAGLVAAKDAQIPYVDAMRAEERTLGSLTLIRDKANLQLARQKDELLTPLIALQSDAEEKVRAADQAERGYSQALELANRALQARKDAMQPLLDSLDELRGVETGIRDAQQADVDRLRDLEGAYSAVSRMAQDWADRLDKVSQAAEKAEEKAKAAAAAKPTGNMAPNLGFDPEALAARQAEMEQKAAGLAEIAANTEKDWAPVIATLTDFSESMGRASKRLDDFAGSADNIRPIINGVGAGLATWGILSTIIPLVTGLVGAIAGATTAGGAMAAVVAFIGPQGLITLGIIAVAAVVALAAAAWTGNWGDIQGKTQAVWGVLEPIFDALGSKINDVRDTLSSPEGLTDAASKLMLLVSGPFAPMVLAWQNDFLGIQTRTGDLVTSLGTLWGYINDHIMPILRTVTSIEMMMFQQGFEYITTKVQDAITWFQNLFTAVGDLGTKFDGAAKLSLGPFTVEIGKVMDAIKGLWDFITTTIKNGIGDWIHNNITQPLDQLRGVLEATEKAMHMQSGAASAPVAGFAGGTDFAPGGWAMVGEQGPELVNLPRGAQVTPNDALGGDTVTINVHPRAGDSEETIARRVADIIEQRQSRTTRNRMFGSGTSFS